MYFAYISSTCTCLPLHGHIEKALGTTFENASWKSFCRATVKYITASLHPAQPQNAVLCIMILFNLYYFPSY